MNQRRILGIAISRGRLLPVFALAAVACATATGSSTTGTSSLGTSSAGSSGSSSSGFNPVGDGGGGGLLGADVGTGSSTPDLPDVVDSGRPPRCDETGKCSCFNIASIGKLGSWGGTTSALMDWLNTESSASVDVYQTKPTLDAAFLAKYDVIVVQWLADGKGGPYWTFSSTEIAALKAWVDAGGGLITLSGFEVNTGEVDPLNQILSFTDISYNKDDIASTCPSNLCYCWGSTIPIAPWAPGPIGSNLRAVGAYYGRSINPGSATVDASATVDGSSIVYAAHETVGLGHVFAWCDEWVTYTSQWLNGSADAGPEASTQYNNPMSACYMQSVDQVFQVPQFWYNAITYAASATQCSFVINNPMVVPK